MCHHISTPNKYVFSNHFNTLSSMSARCKAVSKQLQSCASLTAKLKASSWVWVLGTICKLLILPRRRQNVSTATQWQSSDRYVGAKTYRDSFGHVQARHFSVFSHTDQIPDETDVKILTASELRPLVCPHTVWMKTIQQNLKSNNIFLNETVDMAQNCPLWRLMSTFGVTHS